MPTLPVDPLHSYARRVGDDVKVVLVVSPTDEPLGADIALRLRNKAVLDVPAAIAPVGEGRTRIEALVPGDGLSDGTWRLKLLAPTTVGRRNLQTRLLVRAGMPIALLPGPAPDTRLTEPVPTAVSPDPPARAGRRSRVWPGSRRAPGGGAGRPR